MIDIDKLVDEIERYGGLCSAAADDAERGIDPGPTRSDAAALLAEIGANLRGALARGVPLPAALAVGESLTVAVLVGYDQSVYPVVTMEPVGSRGNAEDWAASVKVPMGVWADYVEARARVAAAEAAIVALDVGRPAP